MAKDTMPIITHTEIICLAIQSLARKIHECDERVDLCDNITAREIAAEMRDREQAVLKPKMAALKEMYRFETGKEFC